MTVRQSRLWYIVTLIPYGRSEPQEILAPVETGDPDIDADHIIDRHESAGHEVLHIRWSNGSGTIYAARGIDR